jgi:hypothetical protein
MQRFEIDPMQSSRYYRVRSFAMAMFLASRGAAFRGVEIDDDGGHVYLFAPETSSVVPAYRAVKRKFDAATALAEQAQRDTHTGVRTWLVRQSGGAR